MTEDANPGGRCDERKAAPADYARKYWWVVAVAVPVVVALIGVLPDLFKRESSGPATNITASYGGTVVTGGTLISGNKFKSKLIIIGGDDLANDPKLADALKDPALRQKFDDAMNLVKEQNYLQSAPLFQELAQRLQSSSLYSDLGVVYARAGKLNHAEAALTQAVELNGDDQPAQFNLGLLKESQGKLKEAGQHFEKAAGVAGAAEKIKALKQFTANNSILAAAPIALNTHIQSVISDGTDSDFFKFNAPPVPRDILKVSLKNLSTSLDPSIHLYDSTKQQISAAGDFGRPGNGADLELAFSDSPGAVFYLQVSSQDSTAGPYSVTVKPEKAFDRYEPNDDILHPAPIKVNEKIEANIMDGNDVDFYSFQALPRGGNVSVQLDNESTTLNPQITLYDSNKEQINSAGSFGRPGSGANLGLQFAADPGAVYFVSISPQDSSAGAYSMTVKE